MTAFGAAGFVRAASSYLPRTSEVFPQYRNNFRRVSAIPVMATVNSAVGLERLRNAALIIHDQIWILPVAAQPQAWTVVCNELCIPRPVMHDARARSPGMTSRFVKSRSASAIGCSQEYANPFSTRHFRLQYPY